MNWTGGARHRIKTQGQRKLQKEFFERKRFDGLASACCRSGVKKGVSQDLLALHTVSRIHSKNRQDDIQRKPIKNVNLDKFQSCTRPITEVDIGPSSPTLTPSRLFLNESKNTPNKSGTHQYKTESTYFNLTPQKENSDSFLKPDAFRSHTRKHSNSERYHNMNTSETHHNRETEYKTPGKRNSYTTFSSQKRDQKIRQTLNPFATEDFQVTPLRKYAKSDSSLPHDDTRRERYSKADSEKKERFAASESLSKHAKSDYTEYFTSTPLKDLDKHRHNSKPKRKFNFSTVDNSFSPIKKIPKHLPKPEEDEFKYQPRPMVNTPETFKPRNQTPMFNVSNISSAYETSDHDCFADSKISSSAMSKFGSPSLSYLHETENVVSARTEETGSFDLGKSKHNSRSKQFDISSLGSRFSPIQKLPKQLSKEEDDFKYKPRPMVKNTPETFKPRNQTPMFNVSNISSAYESSDHDSSTALKITGGSDISKVRCFSDLYETENVVTVTVKGTDSLEASGRASSLESVERSNVFLHSLLEDPIVTALKKGYSRSDAAPKQDKTVTDGTNSSLLRYRQKFLQSEEILNSSAETSNIDNNCDISKPETVSSKNEEANNHVRSVLDTEFRYKPFHGQTIVKEDKKLDMKLYVNQKEVTAKIDSFHLNHTITSEEIPVNQTPVVTDHHFEKSQTKIRKHSGGVAANYTQSPKVGEEYPTHLHHESSTFVITGKSPEQAPDRARNMSSGMNDWNTPDIRKADVDKKTMQKKTSSLTDSHMEEVLQEMKDLEKQDSMIQGETICEDSSSYPDHTFNNQVEPSKELNEIDHYLDSEDKLWDAYIEEMDKASAVYSGDQRNNHLETIIEDNQRKITSPSADTKRFPVNAMPSPFQSPFHKNKDSLSGSAAQSSCKNKILISEATKVKVAVKQLDLCTCDEKSASEKQANALEIPRSNELQEAPDDNEIKPTGETSTSNHNLDSEKNTTEILTGEKTMGDRAESRYNEESRTILSHENLTPNQFLEDKIVYAVNTGKMGSQIVLNNSLANADKINETEDRNNEVSMNIVPHENLIPDQFLGDKVVCAQNKGVVGSQIVSSKSYEEADIKVNSVLKSSLKEVLCSYGQQPNSDNSDSKSLVENGKYFSSNVKRNSIDSEIVALKTETVTLQDPQVSSGCNQGVQTDSVPCIDVATSPFVDRYCQMSAKSVGIQCNFDTSEILQKDSVPAKVPKLGSLANTLLGSSYWRGMGFVSFLNRNIHSSSPLETTGANENLPTEVKRLQLKAKEGSQIDNIEECASDTDKKVNIT